MPQHETSESRGLETGPTSATRLSIHERAASSLPWRAHVSSARKPLKNPPQKPPFFSAKTPDCATPRAKNTIRNALSRLQSAKKGKEKDTSIAPQDETMQLKTWSCKTCTMRQKETDQSEGRGNGRRRGAGRGEIVENGGEDVFGGVWREVG